MSTIANLPVLLQSQPLVAQLASAEQNAPQAQAAFSAELAREAQKKIMEQVQKVEEQDKTSAVKDKPEQEGGGQRQMSGRRREARPKPEPEQPLAKTPWSGNIINVKI